MLVKHPTKAKSRRLYFLFSLLVGVILFTIKAELNVGDGDRRHKRGIHVTAPGRLQRLMGRIQIELFDYKQNGEELSLLSAVREVQKYPNSDALFYYFPNETKNRAAINPNVKEWLDTNSTEVLVYWEEKAPKSMFKKQYQGWTTSLEKVWSDSKPVWQPLTY